MFLNITLFFVRLKQKFLKEEEGLHHSPAQSV